MRPGAALILLLLGACSLPSLRIVHGELVRTTRDWRYEPVCGVLHGGGCQDATQAYDATVQDSVGKRTGFLYFVNPSLYPPGIVPTVGLTATWHLHYHPVYELERCAYTRAMTSTQCPYHMDWMLLGDSDVTK